MTANSIVRWQSLLRRRSRSRQIEAAAPAAPQIAAAPAPEIAPNDPLMAYLQSASGPVDIEHLQLDSPALRAMKEAGIHLVVPLVSQGELIGVLNLGPRLSQQEYSTDDRTLLHNLATQVTPAVRVAQLVRQQQKEAQERERIEHELQVARLIQHTLLPKAVPILAGWQLATYYQPAREVGGDFYDFIDLPSGRLGIVVGDVTDKGVPAALVMATTRSVMRAAATRLESPGQVLERVNDAIYADIPQNMFVTCLYAVLDPESGRLCYANAGHDLPYRRNEGEVSELRATGMPLGLMPGMQYEEKETDLQCGDTIVFYSDGLVEAHSPEREMFGFPRLRELLGTARERNDAALVDLLLHELHGFTGEEWEQEDDITLVTLHYASSPHPEAGGGSRPMDTQTQWTTLAAFSIPSEPGNERMAMNRVVDEIQGLHLPPRTLDRLKTAVAEATMNAMEHGNSYQPDVPVEIEVRTSETAVAVRITDQGHAPAEVTAVEPDLEAKLGGMQTPRGWGLFLIKNMVDEMHVTSDESGHAVELIVLRKGDDDASAAV